MKLKMSFFASNSIEGEALKEEFCSIARTLYHFDTAEYVSTTQKEFLNACLYDDLVIFDATIEDEKGQNYFAVTENAKTLKHVLVVSRTYLPLNFDAIISGGYPEYPNSYTNAQIIEWLQNTIEKRFKDELPRKNKGVLKLIGSTKSSLNFKTKINNENGQIFISYRNSKNNFNYAVKLKYMLEDGEYHQGIKKTVKLIAPGEFVFHGELLPEWRHWFGLSTIERWISAADEFYVCGTHDYLDSWWTIGEIVSLVYTPMCDKIRVYDPVAEKVYYQHPLIEKIKNISLNEAQKKRMARWFANCDPLTMGPESVKAIANYQYVPFINKSGYINDRVFQSEFWNYNILHCQNCFNSEKLNNIDIDNFLWISKTASNLYFTPEQIQAAFKVKSIKCPKCGKEYKLTSKPPRYLWMPTKFGKATGNNNSSLSKIDTYVTI